MSNSTTTPCSIHSITHLFVILSFQYKQFIVVGVLVELPGSRKARESPSVVVTVLKTTETPAGASKRDGSSSGPPPRRLRPMTGKLRC